MSVRLVYAREYLCKLTYVKRLILITVENLKKNLLF